MGVTFLVRNSNPVVASHQVHGFKVLPGLTYIDLIYQFFRRSGHHFAELELHHLAIHQPMVLPGNDDILVEIQAPEIRPGVWRVLIEGTRQQDGRPVAEKACYAMAEMHRCKVRFDPSEHQTELPVPQGRLDSDDIYATFRPRGLVHSGFMQVRGVGFSTPTHAFADVGLSEEAKDSNTQYMFHPALLDGGVTCASGMLPGSDIDDGSPGGGLYIPLSYDGFRATSLVRGRCIARIGHSTLRRRNDLFLVTVDFLDEGGRKVAELRNLALKALRRQDAISEASGRSTGKDTPIVSLASGTRVPKPPAPAAKSPAAADMANDAPTSLRALIAGGIADRLGVSPADIDPSVGYYEMGLDSVGLLHIVKLLEERFGMSLSPTLLFEYTTIDELTDHLVERYGDVLASVPAQASTPVPVTGAEIESRVSAREPALDEPIAIIGMAGRFPLAKNIGELWRNLKAGKDCIAEVPAERWDWHLFDGIEAIAGREVSRWGGFVADVDRFDARFFRVTPRAAEAIDPQERLFLEVSWEAVEDAGYTPRNLVPPHGAGQRRPVGVFAGVMHKDYLLWQAQRLFDGQLQSLAMSNAPIANRVSYFCNFHGPSVVVDTLCSSSLTAVHMATESLRQGECQVALAGGVNLSLHPGKYLTFALLGMHSSDGRCRTFGEGGDGYVAGEGVGVVVLKPLARAIEDNDHVYAVIRGCSVNHVGAVSGISVPSPVAQADLIADCMTKAGVDPRSISYVEAHGTGTALGDPIEIEGLGRAFRTGTDAVGYCAIGSIKSNMGHTESAAGIAGIIKVALQLHHATLVPSLHGERPNPHIDWATTPFVVQTCTAPWNRPRVVVNGEETVHPRRAAVSSFGAAGSNAHAILEEYVERDDPFRAPPSTPAIVPLSAQTPAQVRESAQRLLAYLADGDAVATGDRLHRLAHTLQRGRESHAHRVAFVAGDLDSLQRALRAFLAEATEKHDVFEGAVSPSGRGTGGVMSSPVGIRSALAEGRYADVARAWVAGDLLDWSAIYADPAPRRLPLPTYPFAGERYWVEESAPAERRASSTAGGRPVLHPIVHENTSSLDEQRFTSRFDGTEFFFRDHVVNGAPVLPGVAYLEMAHAALARAMGDASPGHWRLRNAIWVQPIVATGTVASVHVGLHRMPSGELGCEIFAGESTERTIHFQCVATPCEDAPPRIDLDAVRAGCDDELPVAECYELLEAGGLRYGESFRSMRGVWVGKDAEQAPIVLVRLDLPDVARPEANRFGLHPSILDGALQASLGLMRVPGDVSAAPARMTPYVPYALDMLEVFAACHGAAYAVIRNGVGSSAALRKLEVALCDDAGNVLVRMRGFAARRMEGGDPAVAPAEPVTFHERWYEAPIPDGATTPGRIECVHAVATSRDVFDNAATTVDFRLLPAETAPAPQDLGAADALVVLWAVERAPAPSDIPALIAFLRAAALADQPPSRIVLAALCRTPMERACVDAWIALVPSLRRIAPYALQIVGTVVDAHADTHVAMRSALDNALRDLADPAAASAFHEDGERRVRRMVPTPRTDTRPVLRDGGTYLITGGLGGLGGHLAAHLARRYRATLLLIGRSAPDAAAQARMRKWEAHGARIIHARADVADIASLRAAMDVAQENGRRIDGIFHAAGIAAAGSLFDSAPEDIARVLAPKVAGTLALEEAFAGHPLDFICHFSSSSAVLGDFGACAYAVANRFQAACVAAAPAGVRRIAIQWPLWRDGGLGMGDAEATASYLASSGQRALDTEEGIDLLERLLGEAHGVQLVLAGAESSLRRLLASTGVAVETPSVRPATEAQPTPSTDPLASRMLRSLCALLGNAVKLPLDRVSAETPLDDYGFDSILAMQMTNELEKSFGSLPKTLFFEHHDLVSLNGYLLREHRPAVARLLGVADMPDAHVAAAAAPARPPRSAPSILGGHAAPRCGAIEDDIAIVGFNGRFPQAADLDAFWRNLRSGTDSITGIPPERWDHDARFDARKAFFGKTYCRWGGFLDDVDAFDPLFFNMTPVEARFTDPQQRLYLETVWNLLEENGYTRDALRDEHAGNVGVYVGSMYNQYGATSDDEGVDALGTSPQAAIANRVSYFFGLHGPSIAVDTMCSSAFAAIHMACTDLRAGVCTLAIAGGVNLSLHPKKYITLGQAQMLASQAIGRSFGKTDGYLPSEAVGAVLLKPLSAAIEDADTILGVINGSALNHGGRSNGYSVPNPDAQAAVMREALRQARMSASSIGYVEAAANGSPLGDAIEVAALRTVFSGLSEHACAIGAVKSNIGHAEAASGMAQLAKVLLQMRHGERVPTIQTEPPNPAIVLEGSPFRLPRAVEPWPRERTRTALINSFGAGGSNACVVVSEYEQVSADAVPAEPFADRYVVIVSARGVDRLHALVRALAEAVDADPRMRMGDLAYTLQCGREAMPHRLALVVGDRVALRAAFDAWLAGDKRPVPGTTVFSCGPAEAADFHSFTSGSAGDALLETFLREADAEKLAMFWARGGKVPWARLHPRRRRIVALPGYPFARERLWLPSAPQAIAPPAITLPDAPRRVETIGYDGRLGVPVLHPLLQMNSSDIGEYRFSSTFSGDEPWAVRDEVRGLRLLPDVLCLEMLRAAVERVAGRPGDAVRLLDLRWNGPVEIASGPVTVHVGMRLAAAGRLDVEVYSLVADDGDGPRRTHLRGTAVPAENSSDEGGDLGPRRVVAANRMPAPQWIGVMRRIGLEFGAPYRRNGEVARGADEEGQPFTVVDIDASPAATEMDAGFGLPPALVNIALQAAALQIARHGDDERTVVLPAALACRELWMGGRVAEARTAWIRRGDMGDDRAIVVDIDLVDAAGIRVGRCVGVRDAAFASCRDAEPDGSATEGYEIGGTSLLALSHRAVVAPRNELETTLLDIWREVLGFSSIGIFDSFLDLGGSSLLAARVVAMIDEHYRVTIEVPALLRPEGTIARLSELLVMELARQVAAESEG